MDRRDFLKLGSASIASLALTGPAALSVLTPSEAFATSGNAWKFGLMADTQWVKNNDGENPGTTALGIINLLNVQFAHHDVDFVIQVGDLCDSETDAINGNPTVRTMGYRAQGAEALYDAGIGFFPIRGNHEGSQAAAVDFQSYFSQTRGMGARAFGATNFSSPFTALNGLSYSFDYNNVRFVLIDQFTRPDGSNYLGDATNNSNTIDQLPWIDNRLAGRASDAHAFVMSHKNLVGQDHVDTLFGADPSQNPAARNTFINSLQSRGVRYYFGGHDHMHHRSIITSPDGTASVKQQICASNSYKFYTAANPSNDTKYDVPTREQVLANELWSIGYYIFTVDGPRVTIDYYASTNGLDYSSAANGLTMTPTNTAFYKRETYGYSLNGKEFVVPEGGSYTSVKDSFDGTTMAILGGLNGSTEVDRASRKMVKSVNTGWAAPGRGLRSAASNVLSIWGIQESLALWDNTLTGLLPSSARTRQGDTYALSIGYDPFVARSFQIDGGNFGIATRDANGKVSNAVDQNFGGHKHFVNGPWKASYGLGTYGVDQSTNTAWAVINYDGDFCASGNLATL